VIKRERKRGRKKERERKEGRKEGRKKERKKTFQGAGAGVVVQWQRLCKALGLNPSKKEKVEEKKENLLMVSGRRSGCTYIREQCANI
jgi:hypothetical protein